MFKRKWLSALLAVIIVLTMVPMTAFAAGTDCTGGDDCMHVAAIGTKHYETITDAIGEAAEGSNEIKLLQDTTEALTIAEGKDIVLDLNGKTLTTNIALNGTLEVKDTVGGGVIVNDTETTKHAITVNANTAGTEAASLTLTSGTIKTVKSSRSAVYVDGGSKKASGCFTMNGGTLISSNSGDKSSALYGNAYSNIVINGGTIRNETNQADASYYAAYSTANAYITITGGTFEGAVKFGTLRNKAISGGSYTIKPTLGSSDAAVADEYILTGDETNGWKVVPGDVDEMNAGASLTVGSTTTYYKTAKDALTVLGTQEGTLCLMKDESNSLVFTSGMNATLDLNGHTLTGHVDVKNGATLTIKDSTASTAPVLSDDYKTVTYTSGKIDAYTSYAVKVEGVLNVESGSILCHNSINGDFGAAAGIVAYNGGKANINGGYVEAQEFGAKVYGAGSEVVLTGGIVYSKDNAALGGFGADEGPTSIKVTGGIAVAHIEKDDYAACGIYNPQPGTVEITGGKVIADGGVGVLVRSGDLTVTGGEVVGSGTMAGKVGDVDVQVPPSGIVLDTTGKDVGAPNSSVTISGSAVVKADESQKALASEGTLANKQIQVSGGSFSTKVDEEYCADGYNATNQLPDGTFGVQLHQHNAVKTEANAETCTQDGNRAYWYCEGCKKYFSDEACTMETTLEATVIPAKGHGETEIRNAKAATCTEEGYTGDKVCKDCGGVLEKGKPIAKLAHTYKNGKCTVCGASDPNYRPTTEPTEPTEPTTPPTVDPGNNDPKPTDKPTSSPQTGDNSNIWLWVALLFVSAGGVLGTTVYMRRRRTE